MYKLFWSVIVFVAMSAPIHAADWPSGPITILVGYKAGGTTDTQARVYAKVLAQKTGMPVNVVNKPGAGGSVAAQLLKDADPDGQTLQFGSSTSWTFNSVALPDVTYSVEDFQWAAFMTTFQSALVAPADRPYNSIAEFVAYAKDNPGVKYATMSSTSKALMEGIVKDTAIDVDYVPVKGGAGMVPLVLGGQVDIGYSGGIHAQYVKDGKMKVIAAAIRDGRLQATPEVQTLSEAGYPVHTTGIAAVVLPGETPDEIVEKIAVLSEEIANDEEFKAICEKINFPITFAKYPDVKARAIQHRDDFKVMLGK